MIYHTSPKLITTVESGLFGEAVCFASSPYFMSSDPSTAYIYSVDLDGLNIVEECHFAYEERSDLLAPFISQIMDLANVDEDTAMDILSGRDNVDQYTDFDIDASFEVQSIKFAAAVALGYDGVETVDEQGAMWMLHVSTIVNQTPRQLSDFE